MPTQRLSMRRIKQLLTMRFGAGASTRAIARELGVAPSTVREYLGRAAAAGIGWPLAADVTDESLMARLFVNAGVRAGARYYAEPDWAALVRELRRPGVTRAADRRTAARSAGDRRRSLQCRIADHHQPGAGRLLGRHRRQPDPGRRHPGPVHPQRPSHRAERRKPPQAAGRCLTPAVPP